MDIKKIYIAGDHAAFHTKNECKDMLTNLGFEVVDLGTDSAELSVDDNQGLESAKSG